jgi:hypothetical protein
MLGNIPARFRSQRPKSTERSLALAARRRQPCSTTKSTRDARDGEPNLSTSKCFSIVSSPKKIAECRTYRMVSATGL